MSPGLLDWSHVAGLRRPIVACVGLGLAAMHLQALAEEVSVALPLYELSALQHGGGALVRAQRPSAETSGRLREAAPALELQRRTDPRFAMIELPPDSALPGTTRKRPHHALGYRWNAAETWLRAQGIEAQNCYLPMVRLHTKVNSTRPSGTLWVYGRCAFK